MQEPDDNALMREYAEHRSEPAFATLVSRHVNRVYSAALRHTGNPNEAEEITQSVFVLLAEKCRQLGSTVILEGWLYQTARLMALTMIRGEIRRAKREEEASMQTITNVIEPEVWSQIAPVLDSAISSLNEADRHAVVLRFFYGKSLNEIGNALGSSEGAATLRVRRALEKLREFFETHGIHSTTEIIEGAVLANSVQAAPVALAKTIAAAVVAKGVGAGGTTLMLTKGATQTLTWLKATTLAVVLTNAFLSQKIVATHFNWAGEPNGWMTQSQSSIIWLAIGVGTPLMMAAIGYFVRFLPISILNLPNREYWLAPERQGEMFDYWFRFFLGLACLEGIFMLTIMLLEIQANHRTPPHLSTGLLFLSAGCFIIATFALVRIPLRHFERSPKP